MAIFPTKELPKNFNRFLENIIKEETYYFDKYVEEFLPLLHSYNYTLIMKSPSIECLQDSPQGKYPSLFFISYRNDHNTHRQITLLEYLETDNLDKLKHLINELVQYWKINRIKEIIVDTPIPANLLLDRILCPLSFQCIPRIIMVKELSKKTANECINDKNISTISSEDISSALHCLQCAYQNTPWKSLHPEVRNDDEGYEFIKNLINIQQDTEFPTSIQYKLNNQCVGILLGNLTGVQSTCLIHLAVHPAYRRQGIATLLLQNWSNLIKEKGVKNIFLWTHLNNPALKLYLKEHFHPLHVYPAFYCDLRKDT